MDFDANDDPEPPKVGDKRSHPGSPIPPDLSSIGEFAEPIAKRQKTSNEKMREPMTLSARGPAFSFNGNQEI